MFRNYLRITVRNLLRNPIFNLINILSLTIGIVCAVLIILYISHELSYDRFHENGKRIYRVAMEMTDAEGSRLTGNTTAAVGPSFLEEIPEAGQMVRLRYPVDGYYHCDGRQYYDPAIVYDASTDSFEELSGQGVVLGADDKWSFQDNKYSRWSDGQIILIGTDGIWETVNPDREQFGKERVRQIIHQHRNRSAKELLKTITGELTAFRQGANQEDDITLVVIKTTR